MSAYQDMEPWLRSLIVVQLEAVTKRIKVRTSPTTPAEWQDIKATLLAALNDIDRALDYGNPGAGIDRMLGTHDNDDRPTNGDER